MRQRGLCRVDELVEVSYWAPGAAALVAEELSILKRLTFNSWKEVSAFNVDLSRI